MTVVSEVIVANPPSGRKCSPEWVRRVRGKGYGRATGQGLHSLSSWVPAVGCLDVSGRNFYRRVMKAVVSQKGQVTIPKALRDRLGIKPGQVLEFEAANGTIVARKTLERDPIDDLVGILELDRRTDDIISEMRDEEPP